MLEEEAAQAGLSQFVSDLQKIRGAAHTLLATIDRAFDPDAARPAGSPAREPRPAPGPSSAIQTPLLRGRVLVVDDNDMNRDVLARRLEHLGCEVIAVDSGALALEQLHAAAFDLVLLDVMMPGLDGETVLRRIKNDHKLRELPVIMISAHDDVEQIARCIQIGAADYLPKPCDHILLRARVGACLERKALRDQELKTQQELVDTQRKLAIELADAADYLECLLPPPLVGAISAEWRFIPSGSLGGDAFGYHWLDEDHLAIYL